MEGKDIQSSQSANPSASDLCRGGCGFFGNPQWDGYCSKCKDKQVERLQQIQSPNGGRLSPTGRVLFFYFIQPISRTF